MIGGEGEVIGQRTIHVFGPTHRDLAALRLPVVFDRGWQEVSKSWANQNQAPPKFTGGNFSARFQATAARYVA